MIACVGLAVLMLLSGCGDEGEVMDNGEGQALSVVKEFYRAQNAGDFDAILATAAPGGALHTLYTENSRESFDLSLSDLRSGRFRHEVSTCSDFSVDESGTRAEIVCRIETTIQGLEGARPSTIDFSLWKVDGKWKINDFRDRAIPTSPTRPRLRGDS